MRFTTLRRNWHRVYGRPALLPVCGTLMLAGAIAGAQSPANAPASVPAGLEQPADSNAPSGTVVRTPEIPAKQAREAEAAYLQGAKAIEHSDLDAAEKSFARAVQLNPKNRDYALALIVTREHRLSDLVQQAAKQRLLGHDQRADALLDEARKIDPENNVIKQHFEGAAVPGVSELPPDDSIANSLGPAVTLEPKAGTQDVHLRGSATDVLRSLYAQWGITVVFDSSVRDSVPVRIDLEGTTFEQATRVAGEMTRTFAIPVQPHNAMIAEDTEDNRRRLKPQVQVTFFMPGVSESQMSEFANLARTVFEMTSVTASPTTNTIVLRGDPEMVKVLKATYESLAAGGSDVLLDVKLYEVDRTNTHNVGFQLPASAGVFSIASEAEQLVSQNQSTISEAIAAGIIKTTGNSLTDLLTEVAFLIGSGLVNVPQYTNLLGVFGNGLTLSGVYVSSPVTVNLLLNSSDTRTLDAVQLRAGTNQDATFRAGSRYPITTSTYTYGVQGSVASAVAGLNINGTNVGSLLQQALGGAQVTVPQIQFEDIGLTLKATPIVLRSGVVQVKLDLKIESLGGTSLNNIPVLNSRQLTSIAEIPAGQTALLASAVSSQEMRDVQGLPGLSELPGFQSTTNTDKQTSTGELLITITPHVVREGGFRILSRAILLPFNPNPSTQSFVEEQAPPPPPPPQNPQVPPQPNAIPGRPVTPPETTPQQPPPPSAPQ